MLMYTNCFHKHFHTPVSVDMRMPPKRSLSTLESERFYWKTSMMWSYQWFHWKDGRQVMASDLDERRRIMQEGIRIIRKYDLTVLAGEMVLEIFNEFAQKIGALYTTILGRMNPNDWRELE